MPTHRPAPALPPTGVTTLSEVPPPGVIPVPVVLPDMSGRPRKPYKDMDVPKVSQQPAATPIAAWSLPPYLTPSPHNSQCLAPPPELDTLLEWQSNGSPPPRLSS